MKKSLDKGRTVCYTPYVKQKTFTNNGRSGQKSTMAKDFEMGYLLDFYGEVLTPKQREMLNQYYNDDLSLSEIGENFGITRQGARDAIKHGETALKELEADELVQRIQYNEMPLRVEYSLTEKGRDLLPVFYAISQWGMKYIP